MLAVVVVNRNKIIVPSRTQLNESIEKNIVSNPTEKVEDSDDVSIFSSPIDNPTERVTKKRFGTYVTPKNSPVTPERFQGYHTGVDFEIFQGEEDVDIAVKAICSGKLMSKRLASGYGGVAIQLCELDGKPATVVYGHLKLESISIAAGDELMRGENFAILGKGYSNETDGERKHLHLSIHDGGTVNILGYVSQKELLSSWIDPCLYFCNK